MGGNPTVNHGAENAGFIRSKVPQINGFGTWMTSTNTGEHLGKGIKLSAFVKTTNVNGWVGLWMRVDGPGNEQLSFDNMAGRTITGTTDWKKYEIILDVPENSTDLNYGILLDGTGEAWVDGLQLEPAERTWSIQNTGISLPIYSIKAVDENTVWAGVENGVYLKTTDGGQSWMSGTVPGAETVTFYSIAAFDQSTAYFMGQNWDEGDGRIYKTSDGGINWTLQYQNTSPGVFFNSIAFWDQDNGIAVSDPIDGNFLIVTTTDGGENWNRVPPENIPAPLPDEYAGITGEGGTALVVQGTNNAWFGTGNASPLRVLRTTNNGQNWTVSNTPLTNTGDFNGIQTVVFKDSLNGFAGSTHFPYSDSASTLVKTTDGGVTWTAVSSFLPINPSTLVSVPNTNDSMLFVTSGQGSGYSEDGGMTWKISSTQKYFPLSFASPTAGWAAGLPAGRIVKYAADLPVRVAPQQVIQPEAFKLSQNYPNPFNPTTTIEYALPTTGNVRITIFDMLGRHIRTLVNTNQTAGQYQTSWDGTDEHSIPVAAGVYFYKMEAGEYVKVHKLVLVR